MRLICSGLLLLVAVAGSCVTADEGVDTWGMRRGEVTLASIGPMEMGPGGILFVSDPKAGAVYAIGTADSGTPSAINVDDFGAALKGLLNAEEVSIVDLVANPQTGTVFVGAIADGTPRLIRGTGSDWSVMDLSRVRYGKAELSDLPEDRVVGSGRRARNPRTDAVTDLAWYEGKLLISGLRAGDSPSSIRELAFPFAKNDRGVAVEIYHAAHGRDEDYAAARTILPIVIDGEPNVLAAYVCTPLVKLPLKELERSGERVRGTTVAELGNRNRPLDMISYEKDGSAWLLLSNSARGVMKIPTAGLENQSGLTEPVRGGGTAGQPYETVDAWQGVVQMARLDDTKAAVLLSDDTGMLKLITADLP